MDSTPCCICGSLENVFLYEARDYITQRMFNVIRCRKCNMVTTYPMPSPGEIGEYYPPTYYGEEPFSYEKMDADRRYKFLKRFINPGNRILDIGCGRGLLLQKCKEMGCETVGTELSDYSSRYGVEKLGLSIFNIDIIEEPFPDNHFDVITLYHSLEHQHNPQQIIRETYRILKKEGLLLIEVPRFNSKLSTIFKAAWFHLDVPRHLYHFEDQTLEDLVTAQGFTVQIGRNYSVMYDAFGCLQSLLNLICKKKNLLNDLNTRRTTVDEVLKKGTGRDILEMAVSYSSQFFLFPLFLILSGTLVLFNKGGTMIRLFRKQ